MRFQPTLFVAVLWLLFAMPAGAGAIRGTLRVGPVVATRTEAATQNLRDAVIYVEEIPEKVEKKLAHPGFLFFKAKPRMPRVVQMDRKFNPRVLSIAAGTSVVFQNLDQVWHNTFSVSATRSFDLGKYPPGRIDTVTFDRPGVVNLHCDIHAAMVGFVVVAPNHAFTRPDTLGQYKLPSLPEGDYTIHVVHPRYGEIQRQVKVPRGNLALDLKL